MKLNIIKFGWLIATLWVLSGCSIDVDLNAPEKDIWVVFGNLNPKDTAQYIRVSSGYLPEGNALDFARENDLSVKGLNVVLTSSDGNQTLKAVEVDNIPKEPEDGVFYPFTSAYKFETIDGDALVPGETYTLKITKPDNADLELTSFTTIPGDMVFQNISPVPGGPGGQKRCLRPAAIQGEWKLEFARGSGFGFEMRAFLDYKDDGVSKTAVYGPSNMFNENFRCTGGGSNSLCYQFREKIILQSFYNQLAPSPDKVLTYGVTEATRCNADPNLLPDAFRVEVTALDEFLTNYRLANDPKFVDLNTVRPEYSNIEGPEDAVVLGLFGSLNTAIGKVRLSSCAEFLLQLNDARNPNEPCEL